jgi:hypothetical protein
MLSVLPDCTRRTYHTTRGTYDLHFAVMSTYVTDRMREALRDIMLFVLMDEAYWTEKVSPTLLPFADCQFCLVLAGVFGAPRAHSGGATRNVLALPEEGLAVVTVFVFFIFHAVS